MTQSWKYGWVTVLAVPLVLAACQNSRPAVPTQQQGQIGNTEVTLRVGETAFVGNIEISFGGVLEDSRCPVDVVCVTAGNAQASLGVGPPRGTRGPTQQVLLNTTEGARSGEAWGLRVTLAELTPDPRSTQSIPAGDYVIRLKVEVLEEPR